MRIFQLKLNDMKRLFGLVLVIFCCSSSAQAQSVYEEKYASNADVKVFVVQYESEADLLVFKQEYESNAKGNEGDWFFAKYASSADKKIVFVEYKSQADLTIFYVSTASRAGWRNNSKKHLME